MNTGVFEHMREGLCRCDRDFRVEVWNRAAERLTGYGREEVRGRPVEEVLGEEAAAQLRACPGESQGQGAIPLKAGGALSMQLTQLVTPEGPLQLFYPVEASGLISAVAHDLRNPVSSILGFAKLLLHPGYGELSPRQADFARCIRECAEQISRSLGNVALANSLDSQPLALKPENFPLRELLDPLVEDFASQAQRKGAALESPDPNAWTVRGDRGLLRQALYNLLSNALRHTEKGALRLLAEPSGESLRLAVVNHGRPIPAGQLSGLIRKHAQLTGHKRGLGLGLYVTRAILEAHGTRLEIDSDAQATSFAFHLESPEGPKQVVKQLPPMRLLVAGGPATAPLVQRLQALGHEVSHTPLGMEALNLASRSGPQVLCCHPSLLDMSPQDLAAALREHPASAQIPVVLLGDRPDPAFAATLALAAEPEALNVLLGRLQADPVLGPSRLADQP